MKPAVGGTDIALARFYCKNRFEYWMYKTRVTVGRTSFRSQADVDLGFSNYISRNHLEVYLDEDNFFVLVTGKNGVVIDNVFHRRGAAPLKLKQHSVLRFPNTDIRILFQDMLHNDFISAPAAAQPIKIITPKTSAPRLSAVTTTVSAAPTPGSPVLPLSVMGMSTNDPVAATPSALVINQNKPSTSLSLKPKPTFKVETQVKVPSTPPYPKNKKPPYSFSQLIAQAILSQENNQITLNGIYHFISTKYPYYGKDEKGWQNSIRHNLSLNRCFMRVARPNDEPAGKGSCWTLDTSAENVEKLYSNAFCSKITRKNFSHISESPNASDSSTADFSSLTNNDSQLSAGDISSPTADLPSSANTNTTAEQLSAISAMLTAATGQLSTSGEQPDGVDSQQLLQQQQAALQLLLSNGNFQLMQS